MFLQSRKKKAFVLFSTLLANDFDRCGSFRCVRNVVRISVYVDVTEGGVGKAAIYQRVIYVLIKLSDRKVVAHVELGMGKSLKRFGRLRPFPRFKHRNHFSTLVTSGPNSSSHRPVLNWKVGNICRFLQFFSVPSPSS